MNQDEILTLATGLPVEKIHKARTYRMIQDHPDMREVLSIIGIDKRNVLVRDSHPVGPDIGTAATTVTVTALMHLYTVEEHRGKGYALSLLEAALAEAATLRLVPYAALFSPRELGGWFERMGFWHPTMSPQGFMVYELTEQTWPLGAVDTRGTW